MRHRLPAPRGTNGNEHAAASCAADGTQYDHHNYDNTLTYTFTPAGPAAGAGGVITGMTVGTSYTVTASAGACSSAASAAFLNAAQLAVPATPTATTVRWYLCRTDGHDHGDRTTGGTVHSTLIDGTNFQASPAFNNVTPSGYTLTVQEHRRMYINGHRYG